MDVPTASPVEIQEEEQGQELTPELVMEYLPHLDVLQLLEVAASVNLLLKKHWKTTGSKAKAKADKPKKAASAALKRTQAWIPYVQKHVTENGWEEFTIREETKDKETGKTMVEETTRSCSIPNDLAYSYKDAKSGSTMTPAHIFKDTMKHLIYKEAMSLSAILKWKSGVKPVSKLSTEQEQEQWSDLYREFVENYEETSVSLSTASSTPSSMVSSPSSPKVRRLSAAEKEEEKEQKRQIAEEEKEKKRQAKEEEKEQKRLEKEAEKEQKRLEKEAEKEQKRLEKEAEKEQKEQEKKEKEQAKVKKSPVPATVIKKVIVPVKATPVKVAPVKVTAPAAPAPAPAAPAPVSPKPKAAKAAPKQLLQKEKVELIWNIPEDGMVHPWTFQGKTYVVNAEKCVWGVTEDGMPGDWVGMVDLEKGVIDTTVEEPAYDDE